MNSILKRFLSTKTVKNVLHVTAKHTNESIVSTVSQNLVTKLEFSHNFKERNVWKETLVNYNTDHVAAKFRILSGNGNEKDKEIFEPIRVLASELNDTDLLVLSTPLWNFGLPYIMKQYVDIVIQPGINFLESETNPKVTPVTQNKSVVVIYSCGAEVGQDALPKDYLGEYVKDAFNLIGFSDFHSIRISGVMGPNRKENLLKSQQDSQRIAHLLNKKFA